ncbi:hypothetical protein AXW84_11300 [Hymenobacter sp. PAMC 26628]|nr:hypothetical protein AXW84_11300 [Hymenobacter sp. PAMC 26628]
MLPTVFVLQRVQQLSKLEFVGRLKAGYFNVASVTDRNNPILVNIIFHDTVMLKHKLISADWLLKRD